MRGILPMIIEAQRMGYNRIFIPQENLGEAEFINSTEVYTVSTLGELVDFLNGTVPLERVYPSAKHDGGAMKLDVDFNEIKGQKAASY